MSRQKKYELKPDYRGDSWVLFDPDKAAKRAKLAEAKAKLKVKVELIGIIYLLVHGSDRMVKIGLTRVSASGRKTDYVKKHKLSGSWRLAQEWSVTDVVEIEKRIHSELLPMKFSSRAKEVFACSEEEARKVICRHVGRS